ncbi:hypothetical protein [Kouleothrix sp.]|uniref:hypothetical protein n=1 Tax=Kouleothrix sp. TaxID=2779161 RepID=UPI0039199D4D
MQKPIERAAQPDDEEIARWRAEEWPAIKKAHDEQRTIFYVDEAAFYLLPAVVRTYAPVGQTPILRAPKPYTHLSVISGVSETGKLYVQQQACAYRGDTIVGFAV